VVHFVEIDLAFGADLMVVLARSRHEIPAGHRKIENGGTVLPGVLAASPDLPARCNGQELLDAGDVQALVGQKLSQALQPLQIVVGIIALPTASSRFDETFLLVDPQSPGMNVQELGDDSDGVKGFLRFDIHDLKPPAYVPHKVN
jgi:hypothetical protein